MTIATLDLEGVLIPEIWIAFAEASGIPELRITTREEPDYDKLMKYRLDILAKNNIKLRLSSSKIIWVMLLMPGISLNISLSISCRTKNSSIPFILLSTYTSSHDLNRGVQFVSSQEF